MEKFDQPELHPRGFPLWMEILLISALILTPIIAVTLYQAWQDSQQKQENTTTQSTVTETETGTGTGTGTATEVKTDTTEKKPIESK